MVGSFLVYRFNIRILFLPLHVCMFVAVLKNPNRVVRRSVHTLNWAHVGLTNRQ